MTTVPLTGTATRPLSTVTVAGRLSARAETEAEKLTARLDRLPMTRSMWVMAILLTFGGFFDSYAIGLIGAARPVNVRTLYALKADGRLARHA